MNAGRQFEFDRGDSFGTDREMFCTRIIPLAFFKIRPKNKLQSMGL